MSFDFQTDRDNPGKLVVISEEQALHMFEVLPPLWGPGMFAMGEPVSHAPNGVPQYHWVRRVGEVQLMTFGTCMEAQRAFANLDVVETVSA